MQQQYQSLLESMDQGYCIVEVAFNDSGEPVDYRFLETNTAFEKHTGLTKARGRWMRELAPDHEESWFRTYGDVVRTGRPAQFESWSKALNRWFDVHAYRINSHPDRVGILFKDISERKRHEQRLRDSNRRKNEFIATLAHELRNPLSAITNGLQALRLAPDRADNVTRITAMLDRQSRHITRLVEDLLDISRISAGKLELRRERLELDTIVREALQMAAARLTQGRHAVEVQLENPGLVLQADRVRLTQVLVNLLNNAAKFSPDGSPIKVSASRQGPSVLVRVADQGMGIDPRRLLHIFDMFEQDEPGKDQHREGLGIGLTLVRLLVEAHGGHAWATSAGAGQGSEFCFTLPLP